MTNWAKRERWLHDVEARQRNVVFADTLHNEARSGAIWEIRAGPSPSEIGLFVLGNFFWLSNQNPDRAKGHKF